MKVKNIVRCTISAKSQAFRKSLVNRLETLEIYPDCLRNLGFSGELKIVGISTFFYVRRSAMRYAGLRILGELASTKNCRNRPNLAPEQGDPD